jgi:hypothetical protein
MKKMTHNFEDLYENLQEHQKMVMEGGEKKILQKYQMKDAFTLDAKVAEPLMKKGLISANKGKDTFSITDKGKNFLEEAVDPKAIIKELIDTGWSGSNEEQMKAVQLLKGLATSDDPASNAFMKKLDKFTSGLKADADADA